MAGYWQPCHVSDNYLLLRWLGYQYTLHYIKLTGVQWDSVALIRNVTKYY